MNEKEYYDYVFTDYVWSPKGIEIHFACEELPRVTALPYRGSRYFHAIFDQRSGKVTHCDGAIRVYTSEELAYRTQFHIRQSQVRKLGKRIKIFQIDKAAIEQVDFILQITSFFVWNNDVQGYFSKDQEI